MPPAPHRLSQKFAAKKYFGDRDPMGKTFSVDKKTDYKVVGIFEDIPQNSHLKFDIVLSYKNLIAMYGPAYHESWGHTGVFTYIRLKPGADPAAFEPHIYRLMPYGRDVRGFFAVKIAPHKIKEALPLIRRHYDKFFPGNPFEYFFLDDYYNQQYKGDELFGKVFAFFSLLAIFVTGLGIFGLSSFMSVQRTKEIGIRKVLGANVSRIVLFLTGDFQVLVFISFGIALPLSYIGIKQWLSLFANRLSPDVYLFLLPLLIIGVITFLTISSHVIKAALINPVESLKHE